MTERPILFSGPMVRAILEGRKTQTRRLVGLDTLKASETTGYDWTFRGRAPMRSIAQQRRHTNGCWQDLAHAQLMELCPYGEVGARLWVRETWATQHALDARKPSEIHGAEARAHYAATEDRGGLLWRSSRFMPRWASRITLEIMDVRVQRLQDISIEDAMAEGIPQLAGEADAAGLFDLNKEHGYIWDNRTSVENFAVLWDSINAKRAPWSSNPWVWAIDFRRIEQ